MFNTKTLKKIHNCCMNTYSYIDKIDKDIEKYEEEYIQLMNKQEILLKAINEDRLVITKILEHLEKLEKGEKNETTHKRKR